MTVRKNTKKASKRYVSYLRCSTDDQRQGDFTTIDAQRDLNRLHINALGGTLVKEYCDEGRTGTNLDRPGFQEMLTDAEAGEFDHVCVTYMSRLGRGNAYVIAEYELQKRHVDVEMVKEKFSDDLAGYMGKTMTTMMDGVYPKMVSQWTRTKMERMVQMGYFCGGNIPFGYKTVVATDGAGFHSADKEPPRRLVPSEVTAPFVLTAYQMAAEGSTLTEIRDYLNRVFDRTWSITTTKNLLSNETNKGVLHFGEWRNENGHEGIVSAALWEEAQECVHKNEYRTVVRHEDSFTYYLKGLVVCPHCGCPYTMASHHGRAGRIHYYVCQNANRHGSCPVSRVNADKLHGAILHEMARAASRSTVMHGLIAQSGEWSQPSSTQMTIKGQLAKRLQFVDVQIGNFTKAIGEGRALTALLPALEKASAEKAAIEAELMNVQAEIEKATIKRPAAAQVQELWGTVLETWPVLEPGERTEILQTFLHTVEIQSKERAVFEIETIPNSARSMVQVNSKFGSGYPKFQQPANPDSGEIQIFIPSGGILRKKTPRPQPDGEHKPVSENILAGNPD
ncbi:MAG: recombinase family protein [Capsulimonadaceae bacterium]|nr:recombinase family protein [Capsulimonadaceae bacterium]